MPVPVVLGLRHTVAMPPASPFGNGESEFSDMGAACDAQPDATNSVINTLIVEHDAFWPRAQIGFTGIPTR